MTFVVVTGEMLPTAVLPLMAADLGVSPARVGLLVSGWAFVVVVASFPLVRLTRVLDRRRLLAAAIAVFGVASLVTALAGSYAVAAGSRLVAAGVCGLLWATVNAHLAALVPERLLARAVAVVLGGGTLGTVLAVPAANAAGALWGWRTTFAALAALSLFAAAAALSMLAPATARADAVARSGQAGRRSVRPVVVLVTLGGTLLVGHFAAYTFVTELLADSGGTLAVSAALLLFGVLSGVGVLVVGRVGDRFPGAALAGSAGLVAAALLGLTALGTHPLGDVAVVALWGLATGALPPLIQTAVMRAAGVEHRAVAATLIPVVFNLGIAVGAAAGSAVVAWFGVGSLPVPAGVVALLAAAGLAAAGIAGRRSPGRRARGAAQSLPVVSATSSCPA
ncbi:MFS transporter [Georgenia thermotolerans]|nr:MFS transporter [Georgenia thermotolerans]